MEHKNDLCIKEEHLRAQTSTNLSAFDDLMLTKMKEQENKIAQKGGTAFVGENCAVNNTGAIDAVPKCRKNANSRRRSMF